MDTPPGILRGGKEKNLKMYCNNKVRYNLPSLPSKIENIDIWICSSKIYLFGKTARKNENYGT